MNGNTKLPVTRIVRALAETSPRRAAVALTGMVNAAFDAAANGAVINLTDLFAAREAVLQTMDTDGRRAVNQ